MEEKFSRVEYNSDLYEKEDNVDNVIDVLLYSLLLIIFVVLILVTSITPVKAASNNINSNSHSTCGSSMGSGSYYGAFQNGTCYSRAIGTTYSGQANLVGFWLNYNFQAGKYYTITVNFKDNDLLSSTIVDVVRVVDVANNRNEWSSSYNFISKKQFKVYFLAPNNTSSLAFSLASGSGDPITGVSNYGISSIYLEDNDNSDEIITANNQNTQNIINNNNSNAQETQSVIFESATNIINVLQVACKNLFDIQHLHPQGNNSITDSYPSSFMLNLSNSENQGFTTDIFPVVQQGTYSFKTSWSTGLNYAYMVLKIEGFDNLKRPLNFSVYDNRVESNETVTLNLPVSVSYIRVSYLVAGGPYTGQIQFGEPVINNGSSSIQYCQYGTSDGNRLEEIGAVLGGIGDNINTTNDKIDDVNDTLTNSNIDSDLGHGFFNDFSESNPGGISGIVTLPLGIIRDLLTNNNQCSHLPLPDFLGVSGAVLPSGCIFWNKVSSDLPLGITLWNIFVCGVGSYFILTDLFKLVENLKTPTHNKVEVLDL